MRTRMKAPAVLADLQQAFRAAVLGPENGTLDAVVTPSSRIAVYRNTVQESLIDVLAAAFPVTVRIVGMAFFARLARAFIASHPPRAPQLSAYGADIPDFIAAQASLDLPYLAEVARLEWARGESYFAADAALVDPAALVQHHDLENARLRLHPATRLVRSGFAIMTIWGANQPEVRDVPAIDVGLGESALVTRPGMAVTTRHIAESDAMFVEALGHGESLGEAAARALAQDPAFDLQTALEAHLRHGTFSAAC